jgi:hypothetical protein
MNADKDLAGRLDRASAAFAAFQPAVEAGDPWPLSPAYGSEPESDWGPKELLAHTAEMFAFWQAEIDRIMQAGSEPLPFGRVSTDPARIEAIGRDRLLPTAELFDRIAAEAARLDARIRALTPADASSTSSSGSSSAISRTMSSSSGASFRLRRAGLSRLADRRRRA